MRLEHLETTKFATSRWTAIRACLEFRISKTSERNLVLMASDKVVQILEQNGFKRLSNENIIGGFSSTRDSAGQFVLVDSKGNGFSTFKGEENADAALDLFNESHLAGWFTDEWWSKRKESDDEK